MECGSASSRLLGSQSWRFVVGVRAQKERRQLRSRSPRRAAPAFSMTDWPHSPTHRLTEAGAYMVTCGTYLKQHHFRGAERLQFLCEALLRTAAEYNWNLQAWAVFSNHYHFVALSPGLATCIGRPCIINWFESRRFTPGARWVGSSAAPQRPFTKPL